MFSLGPILVHTLRECKTASLDILEGNSSLARYIRILSSFSFDVPPKTDKVDVKVGLNKDGLLDVEVTYPYAVELRRQRFGYRRSQMIEDRTGCEEMDNGKRSS